MAEARGCMRAAVTFCIAVLLLASGVISLDVRAFLERPVVEADQSVVVAIPPGSSWKQVVKILDEHGLLHRPMYFDIWARRHGLPNRVKAGRLTFTGPLDLAAFAAVLEKGGDADEISVTIPEGYSIFHIADRLEAQNIVSRAQFLRAARDREFLAEHKIPGESAEGYLFPDTYRFRLGVTAPEIVQAMVQRHEKVWTDLLANHPGKLEGLAKLDLTERDIVTLASLIEKESGARSERPKIARVFLNRLAKKMRLQTDPTCVYAEDTYREVPHPKYCKDPLNRYSTYVIDGLPPGPIANPGRSSLEAALMPSQAPQDFEMLYFVARRDGSGTHYFSRTYDEHRKAVNTYLK